MAKLTMTAAVCDEPGPGDVLDLRKVVVDDPHEMEVRVKISTTAICRSDIHYLRDVWLHPKPAIFGHEACGVIESVGPGVPKSRIGEKVILTFTPSCGHCKFCVTGRSVLCEEVARAAAAGTMWDDTTRFFELDGSPIHHLSLVSSFCDYTVVPHNGAITIDPATSDEQACLLGCGAMAGIGAAINTAQIRPGESVAVFGCGGVGLSVVQGAKLCNALPIIAVDKRAEKEAEARHFGATHFVDASKGDPVAKVREITGGGADFTFEATGEVETAELCYKATCRAGTTVLIGQPTENALAGFPPYWIAQDENKVIGSSYGSTRPMIDFPKVLRLVKHGLLDLESLISDVWPLSRINEAIRLVETGTVKRMVLRPGA
ncbi:MAG TPA: zinc-binding dehydrogenase [Dongiaceae bacterium]|jgi:Zn-dependent alcohol dehydrogenase|nr:zinc-binding dehydrogenase [Dongiaceae bacterium]